METRGERGGGLRAAVERRSATAVVFLHRLPRWVLLVAVFVLLVIGMAGTGWVAAAGLLVLAAAVGVAALFAIELKARRPAPA